MKVREPEDEEDPSAAWLYPAAVPVQIDGVDEYACPKQHLHENGAWWTKALMYYYAYEKNHLPDPGAISDQPNAGLKVLQIMQGAFSQAYNEKRDEASSKGDPRA